MFDRSTTVGDFLIAAAAKQPTPGGGSVTALVGALAVSMGEMAINYSVGKKGLEALAKKLSAALAELTRARGVLLELMIEDQAAYEAMTAVRKLPADAPERQARFDACLLACIRIPEAIAATGVAALEIVERVADSVNPYLLSDLAVCAELAMATVRCGVYNVRANLPDVKDPADRTKIESAIGSVLGRGGELLDRVIPRIWGRHEQAMG